MKAVVKYGLEDKNVELREVPEPNPPGDGEVLLEVKAAGVCGSDIEFWRQKINFIVNVPVIQGHEFCGVVRDCGVGVDGFRPGDRVTSETAAVICGECPFCRAGEYNVCPNRLGFGYGIDGAFTNFVRVPTRCLHRIPENVPFKHAALTEPFSVAYNALVMKSRISPGEWVVVIGPGPIGLFAAQLVRICGGRVILCGMEVDQFRLETAGKLGVERVVVADRGEAAEEIRQLVGNDGAPLVVDAAGSSPALRLAVELVRRNGQITKIGWGPAPVDFSLDPLIEKAARLQGSFSHTWQTWENCLQLMAAGSVNMDDMITHEYSIAEWETAYELVEERQAVKAVLRP